MSEASADYAPTEEDLSQLEFLKKIGEVPKFETFSKPKPPKYDLNTATDKLKKVCTKYHVFLLNRAEKNKHLCTLEVTHSWEECMEKRGAWYSRHPEESKRCQEEKVNWREQKAQWEIEESA